MKLNVSSIRQRLQKLEQYIAELERQQSENVPSYLNAQKIADFCRRHQVRQIQLFGSALRDDLSPENDVRRELSELFQRPVDLVLKEGLKPRIREAVLSSAEVIYEV